MDMGEAETAGRENGEAVARVGFRYQDGRCVVMTTWWAEAGAGTDACNLYTYLTLKIGHLV